MYSRPFLYLGNHVEVTDMHQITYAIGLPVVLAVIIYVIGKAVTLRWYRRQS